MNVPGPDICTDCSAMLSAPTARVVPGVTALTSNMAHWDSKKPGSGEQANERGFASGKNDFATGCSRGAGCEDSCLSHCGYLIQWVVLILRRKFYLVMALMRFHRSAVRSVPRPSMPNISSNKTPSSDGNGGASTPETTSAQGSSGRRRNSYPRPATHA